MTDLQKLAEDLEAIAGDGGRRYFGPSSGVRKYDPDTGMPYFTEPKPSELTVHGLRADRINEIISNAEKLARALRDEIN
jgi:hypothetical protein